MEPVIAWGEQSKGEEEAAGEGEEEGEVEGVGEVDGEAEELRGRAVAVRVPFAPTFKVRNHERKLKVTK